MTAKSKGSYGKTMSVAISLPVSIVEEVEKRRRFDSRSRYILRAVDKYLREEQEQEREETGVKGSQVLQTYPTSAPTPTSTEARKTNMPLYNGGLGA